MSDQVISILAFSCVHLPINHQRSTDWLIDAVEARRPDRLVSMGDMLDCASLSKHPAFEQATLEQEIEAGREFLEDLHDASPKSELVLMGGNHEQRAVREENKKFGNLVQWEHQLRDTMRLFPRCETRPYRNSPKGLYSCGQVTFCHGYSTSDSQIRYAAYAATPDNGLFCYGHTHRGHDPSRIRFGSSQWVRCHYVNPGTFIDPETAKEGYAQTYDTSLWSCGYLWITVKPKRKHSGKIHWTCERVKCPHYPSVQ